MAFLDPEALVEVVLDADVKVSVVDDAISSRARRSLSSRFSVLFGDEVDVDEHDVDDGRCREILADAKDDDADRSRLTDRKCAERALDDVEEVGVHRDTVNGALRYR